MAFNIFATATSDIPLANLDANFTMIGSSAVASTLYPTATTSITYGTTGTIHYFSGSGLAVTGTLSAINNVASAQTTDCFNNNASGSARVRVGHSSPYCMDIYRGGASADIFFDATQSSANINFQIAGSTKVTLDSSGNLGLGVTPSAWGGALSAGMDFKFSGGIASHNSANAFYLVANGYYNSSGVWKYRQNGYANYVNVGNGDGSIAFYTAASGLAGNSISFTQAMTLDASGNLGIGTTNPSGAIGGQKGIVIDGGANQPQLRLQNTTSGTSGSDGFLISHTGVDSYLYSYETGALIFGTSNTERARINSSGHLLVGTTTDPSGIFLRTKGTNGDQFEMDNDGSQFTSFYLSNNGTIKLSSWWDNSNARYQITPVTNGVYLASGGVAWVAISDERVKDIIEPIENATDKLSGLRTIVGKYKTDEEGIRRSFLIAQDVQAVFPEAVDSTNQDELGLRYQDLIPVLVKAIQELSAKVTALEAK